MRLPQLNHRPSCSPPSHNHHLHPVLLHILDDPGCADMWICMLARFELARARTDKAGFCILGRSIRIMTRSVRPCARACGPYSFEHGSCRRRWDVECQFVQRLVIVMWCWWWCRHDDVLGRFWRQASGRGGGGGGGGGVTALVDWRRER